jgi:hypothetical protein
MRHQARTGDDKKSADAREVDGDRDIMETSLQPSSAAARLERAALSLTQGHYGR